MMNQGEREGKEWEGRDRGGKGLERRSIEGEGHKNRGILKILHKTIKCLFTFSIDLSSLMIIVLWKGLAPKCEMLLTS